MPQLNEAAKTESQLSTLPSKKMVVAQNPLIPWAEKLLAPIFGASSVIGSALGGINISVAAGMTIILITDEQMEQAKRDTERGRYIMRALVLTNSAIEKMGDVVKKQKIVQSDGGKLFEVKISKNGKINDYKVVFMAADRISLKLARTHSKDKIEVVKFERGEEFYVGKLGTQWILFHFKNNYLLN
jgi:hypothetical protein